MESFKSYVVTNNTHVDRYDPSYPAYPAYTRPIPGPQVGPADRKVGRFRESNDLPCPPERCPWPQSAWFRSIRDGYVAQARFCNGLSRSATHRPPNTPIVRFQCNHSSHRVTEDNGFLLSMAKTKTYPHGHTMQCSREVRVSVGVLAKVRVCLPSPRSDIAWGYRL